MFALCREKTLLGWYLLFREKSFGNYSLLRLPPDSFFPAWLQRARGIYADFREAPERPRRADREVPRRSAGASFI